MHNSSTSYINYPTRYYTTIQLDLIIKQNNGQMFQFVKTQHKERTAFPEDKHANSLNSTTHHKTATRKETNSDSNSAGQKPTIHSNNNQIRQLNYSTEPLLRTKLERK